MQGNPYHGYSLQVLALKDSFTSIEIPEYTDNDFLLYVERIGTIAECPNRYVLLSGENRGCSVCSNMDIYNLPYLVM